MSQIRIVSLQVGLPRRVGEPGAADPMQQPWESAIFKLPVEGPIQLSETGLDGDGVADRRVHGGLDKAVLAYSAEHYPDWREELAIEKFSFGAFGENMTIEGSDEASVCLGDRYAVGKVRVEVSQPRPPCWKLSRKWGVPDLTRRVYKSGRTGWYFRVLQTGTLEAGAVVELTDRPHPDWTVARANEVMRDRKGAPELVGELASLQVLSAEWREGLTG